MPNKDVVMISNEPETRVASPAKDWDTRHVMTTYARQNVEFVRGQGVTVWDSENRAYLDFLGGIAVISVGHCHPRLTRAVQQQAATLMHVSNLYLTEPQAHLARRLVELSDMERVFFCNSGAEANEAAIKLARKFGRTTGGETKTNIVTALNSFHGRTLATVTATGQPKYSAPFAPLPGGFGYVPFNDIAALEASVNADTCAVFLEPIQGEGGIIPATKEYLQAARALCDKFNALLILDEVQTGVGRTGKMWAYQSYGVVPDVITSAKGLGGGVPIGACLARGKAADVFVPGDHGSTFAGNPLAASAANAVLDILADEDLLRNARDRGAQIVSEVAKMREKRPDVWGQVRGAGLMVGVGLEKPVAKAVVGESLALGLILNAVGDNTLRLLPPLTVTEAEVADAMTRMEAAVLGVLAQ